MQAMARHPVSHYVSSQVLYKRHWHTVQQREDRGNESVRGTEDLNKKTAKKSCELEQNKQRMNM